LYIDRMLSRSFMSIENLTKHWSDKTFSYVQAALDLPDLGPHRP
jgi:hypothetical protein